MFTSNRSKLGRNAALRRPDSAACCPYLCSRGALFENVIVNRVYIPKGFSRDVGIWNADANRLFHTYNQLQRIARSAPQSIRTEKRELIADLFRRNLKHQVFDQHLLDLG